MTFFANATPFLALLVSIGGVFYAYQTAQWVLKQDAGNETMQRIAAAIQEGAQAFLQREYRYVGIVVVVVTVLLLIIGSIPNFNMSQMTAVAFLFGALASGTAGYFGMIIATSANVRTTQAASKSLNEGLQVAFSSGSVMGTTVVSLALLGISVLYLLFNAFVTPAEAAAALAGFGFGGTTIAIFARVGGGIFTKAADVGADLVGKTEAGIPEDDPRNPAVIADNVGDNVGDVAGMGSDLFESYASSIIAAMSLAALGGIAAPWLSAEDAALRGVAYPLLVAAVGILIAIGSTRLIRTEDGATQEDLLTSLRTGVWGASAMVAIAIILIGALFQLGWGVIVATLSGLVGGVIIGYYTEYYTSDTYKPTQQLAASAQEGTGIVVIRGLSVGMESTLPPVVVVIVVTLIAIATAGFYGVAVAAVGMLSTLGITLATDAYGPVADNAGGIAEMSELEEGVRDRTDALDSLGNTTAATGKGFAIGSAAMTALALTAAFLQASGLAGSGVDITQPDTLSRLVTGLMIGAVLPYIFSAQTMLAVSKAAGEIVEEVRRQFREIPGLMEGEADPDYKTCVAISTESAIREMVVPGIIAIATPVVIVVLSLLGEGNRLGTIVGAETMVGMLLGSLISAFMLAVMMANAGGAWDNAKKYIERGEFGGKGSDAHKAAVVGDTIGDPFKDTSGPSLNILLKLLAIVSLVLAPLLA
ncbi:MAG: sodium-translocating pyrophosphatase [Chloroflexota bacterium]